jgi:glyoxylase-like metal-dependent hydrolase (beta-lactamase superfamily II)
MGYGSAVQIRGGSWIIPGPTNIGIVEQDDGVYLVDSGNDKEAGRNILKSLAGKGWKLKAIINTHSNADHIGGNKFIQDRTNCGIWATLGEAAFINSPTLEASFLWGGYPFKDLRSKFFEAQVSRVTTLIRGGEARDEMRFVALPGHFVDMIGILTKDRVLYLGDSAFGAATLEKHGIPFIYDVQGYKDSIEALRSIEADFFVPSHGEVQTDIGPLADLNLKKVEEVEGLLLESIEGKAVFEDILQRMVGRYGITLDHGTYVLVGSTIRSFLSYLHEAGRASYEFTDNKMYWSASA